MTDDTADERFVNALRSELAERVTAQAHEGPPSQAPKPRSRNWRVPIVTATTGVLVAAASVAVLVGVGSPATVGASPSVTATKGSAVLLVAPATQSDIYPATAAGQGTLHLRADGCVMVGSSVLIAPHGSTLTNEDKAVDLAGIGRYNLGADIPALGGMSHIYTTNDLPAAYADCGTGTYMELWPLKAPGGPRLLVSPVSPSAASGVGFEGRVTVDSGGCIAVGNAALVGQPGSSLDANGSIRLANPGGGIDAARLHIGDQFRLGGTLVNRGDDSAQRYLPATAGSCGSKRYLLVFGG